MAMRARGPERAVEPRAAGRGAVGVDRSVRPWGKAGHYRRIGWLREYVLVSQSEQKIEVQRLNERGFWELRFFGPGERVELSSLGVSFLVDAVYENPLEG